MSELPPPPPKPKGSVGYWIVGSTLIGMAVVAFVIGTTTTTRPSHSWGRSSHSPGIVVPRNASLIVGRWYVGRSTARRTGLALSARPTRSSGPRADATDCSQSAPRRSRRRRICPTRDRTVRADTFPELYERGDNDALLDSLHDLEADPVMRGWLVEYQKMELDEP